MFPTLEGRSFTTEPQGSPETNILNKLYSNKYLLKKKKNRGEKEISVQFSSVQLPFVPCLSITQTRKLKEAQKENRKRHRSEIEWAIFGHCLPILKSCTVSHCTANVPSLCLGTWLTSLRMKSWSCHFFQSLGFHPACLA